VKHTVNFRLAQRQRRYLYQPGAKAPGKAAPTRHQGCKPAPFPWFGGLPPTAQAHAPKQRIYPCGAPPRAKKTATTYRFVLKGQNGISNPNAIVPRRTQKRTNGKPPAPARHPLLPEPFHIAADDFLVQAGYNAASEVQLEAGAMDLLQAAAAGDHNNVLALIAQHGKAIVNKRGPNKSTALMAAAT